MCNSPEVIGPISPSDSNSLHQDLDLEYLDRQIRPRTPDWLDNMEGDEANAKAAYAELVRLGARPSRPIRERFAYTTVNNGDYRNWRDEEDGTWYGANVELLMPHHWEVESALFQGQLDRWHEFREVQATSGDDCYYKNHLLLRPTETHVLEYNDPILTQKLTTLRDWRAYRTFYYTKLRYYDQSRDAPRRQVTSSLQRFKDLADPPQKQAAMYNVFRGTGTLETRQKEWLVEKAISDRIEDEIPKILEETVNQLSTYDPILLVKLEEDAARTAYALADRLGALSGSKWPVHLPDTLGSFLEKLNHWEREISRLASLFTDWAENIEWMQQNHDPMDDDAIYLLAIEPNAIRNRKLWGLHVRWRQRQLEKAEKWEKCWEGLQAFCAVEHEKGSRFSPSLPNNFAEEARKHRLASQPRVHAAVEALKLAQTETSEALHQLDQENVQLPKCPWGTPSEWVEAIIVRKRKADEDAPMTPPAKRVCLPDEMAVAGKLRKAGYHVTASTPISGNHSSGHTDGTSAHPVYPTPPSTGSPGSADRPVIIQDTPPSQASSVLPKPATPSGRRVRIPKNTDHQNLNKNARIPGAPRYNLRPRISTPEGEGSTTLKPDETRSTTKDATTMSLNPRSKKEDKVTVTKTGRVSKLKPTTQKNQRAEAKANSGLRRSERVKR